MSSKSSTVVGVIVAVLIIGGVAALGYYQFQVAPGLNSSTTSTGAPPITCPSSKCVNVTIPSGASSPPAGWATGQKTTYGYTPDSITVVIGKNNTVYFTNDDPSIHTATSNTAGAFDTGNINQGASAQITFTTPGTYAYHCTYHAWMQGTIVVKSA